MLEQEQVSGGACVYRTNFTLHGLKESHLQVCLGRPASAGPVRSWDRMNGLDVGVLVNARVEDNVSPGTIPESA